MSYPSISLSSAICENRAEGSLLEDALVDPDANALKRGSAYVALRTNPPFGRYVFVDRNPEHAESLDGLRQEFPDLANRISVEVADANVFLQDWCRTTDWKMNRAVVLLDPYGMQVDWFTSQPSMFDNVFGEETGYAKRTNFRAIGRFSVSRLEQVFAGVSKNPLRNSKGVPLYLLCFAAANPKGVGPAPKIANYVLHR